MDGQKSSAGSGSRARPGKMKAWLLCALFASLAHCAAEPAPTVATFSIVAVDPKTGEIGVAVQSRFLGVGAVVPWAKAGVGAIATQALANIRYGPEGLNLLAQGKSPEQALEILTKKDGDRESRQCGIVDAQGRSSDPSYFDEWPQRCLQPPCLYNTTDNHQGFVPPAANRHRHSREWRPKR